MGSYQLSPNGTYGSKTGTIVVETSVANIGGLFTRTVYSVIIKFSDGIKFEYYDRPEDVTIPYQLILAGVSGKTLMIFDLPVNTSNNGLPVGTVYRDVNGFLRVIFRADNHIHRVPDNIPFNCYGIITI